MSRHFVEMRAAPRIVINACGKLLHLSKGLHITHVASCRVIDVSKGGAQLELDSPLSDDLFYLEMDIEPNRLVNCRVVRRRGNRVGVVFI